MKKLDYLKMSIENGHYLKRVWLVSMFGVLMQDTVIDRDDVNLSVKAGKLYVTVNDKEEEITDFIFDKPLFSIKDVVTLPEQFIPMIKKETKTTLGMFVLNLYLLHYPYGALVDYVNSAVKAAHFDNIADKLLREKKVTVDQHVMYENAAGFITLFGQLGLPSITKDIISPSERILKLRDELVAKNKDKLDDPVVIAAIMDEIADAVRAEIKGTPAEDFLIGAKSIQPGLLRTKYIFGSEPDFYDEGKIVFIATGLAEGWKYEDVATYVNAARAGSIDRGGNTALAGVVVKGISRATQDYAIAIPDCGTKRTIPVFITEKNHADYIGRYYGDGSEVTPEAAKSAIGKMIHIRSPGRCEAEPHPTFCQKCFGRRVSEGGVSINGLSFKMQSTNLAIFMQSFHTTVLSVSRYTVKDCIS